MPKLLNYYQADKLEAGCDEAGRGCYAGPVFAAAVILPKDFYHPLINDSKKLSEKQRAISWHAIISRKAKVILGTRLSILTPIPNLAAIVVDEEHDSSFKQQEGLGYSARDLAIWRAKNENIPVLLSSATPSPETWHAIERGRYQEIKLSERIHQAQMPEVELVQIQEADKNQAISASLRQALLKNYQQGRQALILVNRRGFAPVLTCGSCAWLSECPDCSGYMVMHKQLGSRKSPALCCHHCGLIKPIPLSCPKCGDSDLHPLGRGTQKIEEQLEEIIPHAKVLRVDADTARTGKLSEALFAKIPIKSPRTAMPTPASAVIAVGSWALIA